MAQQHPNAPTSQLPAASTARSDHHDDVSADELPGTGVLEERNGKLKKKPKDRRRRRRFQPDRRQQVAMVRQVGACEKCRTRKVACKHALEKTDALSLLPQPNPSTDELNFCGSRWPLTGEDQQQPAESYNPTLNLDTTSIPQHRMSQLQYVEALSTIVDGRADAFAPAWSSHAEPTYPGDDTLNMNTHVSPNMLPQHFHSPTTAYSVSTYDRDDLPYRLDEGGHGGAVVPLVDPHDLPLYPSPTHGDLYPQQQQQLFSEGPADEQDPNHILWGDPNPIQWQPSDTRLGTGPLVAVDWMGPGKMAQVQQLLSGTYHPGMKDNLVNDQNPSGICDDDMVQMVNQLGRLDTSSRAARSVSGRSQAGVQKSLRRRNTNPLGLGDHLYRRQPSQPRQRLSVSGHMYAPPLHGMDAVTPYPGGDLVPDSRSLHALQPPLSPQGHQQPSGAWVQASLADMGPGHLQMFVTEHLYSCSDWTHQPPPPPSPSRPPFPSAQGGEGYLRMEDHLPRTQDYSNGSTALPSSHYEPRFTFSDGDLGDFPPSSHQPVPIHLQRRRYHAAGASANVPSASASRHHSRQPSIVLGDRVIHDPEQNMYTNGPIYHEPSSSNALSYPPPLDLFTNYSGSVSSVGNDSLRSFVRPIQAAHDNNGTGPVNIGGASSHAGSRKGAHHLVGADVNQKFMAVSATEVEVQGSDMSSSGTGDDVGCTGWGALWEMNLVT